MDALHRPVSREADRCRRCVARHNTSMQKDSAVECSVAAVIPTVVMVVVVVTVEPTRHAHDDAEVMMVMMPIAAVMMVMTHTDIKLRHLHVGFIAGRSRVSRPQGRNRVRDRIEQLGKRLGRRHAAEVLNGRRGGLRAPDGGQSRDCADDTYDCFFHGAFPLG